MGLNSENAKRLVFDIETCPLTDAADYIEPADAPANYKDPLKIAAYVAEKTAESLDKCGLDVDLCRVVAIGDLLEGEDNVCADVCAGGDVDEASLLAAFWCRAEGRHLVGFNCIGFDLPVLIRRSQYLGIKVPSIQIDKYRHPQVTDLALDLSFNGAIRMRSLSFYCRRFGIPCPIDLITGAGIAQAVKDGRYDLVDAHVRADVRKTAGLAERLGMFQAKAEVFASEGVF